MQYGQFRASSSVGRSPAVAAAPRVGQEWRGASLATKTAPPEKKNEGERSHTFQRREAAIEDQLEIAKVSLIEDQSRELLRLINELGLARKIASEEVLEDAAVGRVRHGIAKGCGVFVMRLMLLMEEASSRGDLEESTRVRYERKKE